jgi:hypothetical protein
LKKYEKIIEKMKYTIDLTHIKTFDLFDKVLSVNRKTNLFQDLRNLYVKEVQKVILQSGIKTAIQTDNVSAKLSTNAVAMSPIPSLYDSHENLDVDFCAGYGAGERTLSAISYQHGIYHDLPSLDTFVKRKNFSIGNFGFLVDNGDYEIEIIANNDVKIVGYSSQINAKKRKSFIAILGVHFDYDSILMVYEKYLSITKQPQLIDVKISTVNYPQIFMCRITGKFYACNCFKDYIDWKWDFERFTNFKYEEEIAERVKNITWGNHICHYCNKTTPATETPVSGWSSFLRRFAPYYLLECKKRWGDIFHFEKGDCVNLENELREYFSYPKIGERWTTETLLYNLVKEILPNQHTIFHYRGKEMQGLELDIFIPELKLGIEYQGEQHFNAIEHWGGEEGLEQRKKSDERKKYLCEKNGYTLVEFFCMEEITKNLVVEKLEKYVAIEESVKTTIKNEESEKMEEKQKAKKQAKTTEIDYNLWIDTINQFLEYRYTNEKDYFKYWNQKIDSDDGKIKLNANIYDCLNSLQLVAKECVRFGKFKDKMDYFFAIGYYGPEVIIKSIKTECEYTLGFVEQGFFLSTHFKYSNNIRYMSDDFWKFLLELSEFEGFSYDEYERISSETEKEYSELFVSNKSMIFKMLRKYFFDFTADNNGWKDQNSYLGELSITFPFNKPFEDIIKGFCLGFKQLYKLNYMLWKVSDLKAKQK